MRPLSSLRWYIGALLFLSTVINYIDRQTLSVLAPVLKEQFRWTNSDFALLVIAFRVAYSFGQTASGRLLDRVGTRAGLSVAVAFYSTVAVLTSLASGLRSFIAFRFLLGAGESANWPGATKAVSEWFPRRESGWAVALFDSGSSIGAALELGGADDVRNLWAEPYTPTPGAHEKDRVENYLREQVCAGNISLPDAQREITTDWFAVYLASRGFTLEDSLLAFWVPFLAADLGNFAGGGVSSALIARGWRVGAARKLVVVLGTLAMLLLIPTLYVSSLGWLTTCFAIATFGYAALSTMILNLPADIYPTRSVASVSGMGGTAAGVGTIAATYLTGVVADRYSFAPILMGASLVPLIAMVAVLVLVRNNAATRAGVVSEI